MNYHTMVIFCLAAGQSMVMMPIEHKGTRGEPPLPKARMQPYCPGARCYNLPMLKELRELVTPAWIRSFLALAFVLLAMSFMNTAVFPLYDSVNVYVREVTTSANILTMAGIGLVAFLAPSHLNAKALNIGALAALAFAAAMTPMAFGLSSTPLLVCVSIAIGCARAWVIMSVGLVTSRLSRVQIGSSIIAAFLLYYPCNAIALNAPIMASVVLFHVLPMLTLALTWRGTTPVIKAVAKAEPPLDLAVTQPNTFLPLGSQVFVCLFLFRVTYGFALRFGEESGTPLVSVWGILVVILFALYMAIARKSLPIDSAVNWSVLLVIVGFYVIAVDHSGLARFGVTLLSAGSTLFDMVSWMLLLAIMSRNVYGSVAAFAWGHSLMGMGTITGAQIAVRYNDALANEASLTVLLGCFIALFAAYALFSLRDVSFAAIIRGIAPAATGDAAVADVSAPVIADAASSKDTGQASARNEQAADETDAAGNGNESAARSGDADKDSDDAREQGQPPASSQTPSPAPLTIEERCEAVRKRCGLTKRETEVLGMLARGRNRAYIEEALVVSRNTVNSHVKHIYAKLDIHSHQELIDIIEAEE